jgi:hypothetical protein
MYKPVDPHSRMQSTYSYGMRGGAYPPRYVLGVELVGFFPKVVSMNCE